MKWTHIISGVKSAIGKRFFSTHIVNFLTSYQEAVGINCKVTFAEFQGLNLIGKECL